MATFLVGAVPAGAVNSVNTTGPAGAGTTPVAPPPGSSCGQTLALEPKHSLSLRPPPLALGDSILYDAAAPLSDAGFAVNTMVCRTMAQGLVWLAQHQRALPVLVVVALGTNGPVSAAQIRELLALLGPERALALVTPHGGNYAYVPGLYRELAREYPDRIELLDREALSAHHPQWFAPDAIHLVGAAGSEAYTRLILSALLGEPAASGRPATAAKPGSAVKHSRVRRARIRKRQASEPVPRDSSSRHMFEAFGVFEAVCLEVLER